MEPWSRSKKPERKAVLDIASVLAYYGMDAPSGYGWKKFKCHGERKASAVVNVEEGAVNCFSCGLKGDSLAVIMKLSNIGFKEALEKYKEITGEEASGFADKSNRSSHSSGAAENRSYESSWLASKLKGR